MLENLNTIDNLLIVDDVFSTGMNVHAVIARLESRLKRNMPKALKVAALWYKPASRRTERTPDYFQHKTDNWLVLPYELTGLSSSELEQQKPYAFEFLKDHVN